MRRPSFRQITAGALAALCSTTFACGGGEPADDDEIPPPSTTPFSSEQSVAIHEIRDAVMEVRGLSPVLDITEGTLTRDANRAYYEQVNTELSEEDRAELETYNTALRMLRIIGPNDDLLTLFTGFWGEAGAGFYSLDDNQLVLIGDGADLSYDERSTVAHEYVHALQDASFDIDRLDELVEVEDENEDGAPTEYGVTTSCLIEGDAELAELGYQVNVLGEEPEEDVANPPASPLEQDIPPGFLRYMAFDYNECPLWALAMFVEDEGEWTTIDQAYTEPPWTTEQILHPEKYLAREHVTGMQPLDLRDRLGKGWERIDSAIFGEFDVYNYIATVLEDEQVAATAAAGWGVGWMGIYAAAGDDGLSDDRSVVYVSLEFDTPQDYREFVGQYNRVVLKLAAGSERRSTYGTATCWTGALEHAYVGFDETNRRADIVMATDDEALLAALSEPLSASVDEECPGE